MTSLDPTETHALFGHDRVGAGYASVRPFLHPEAFARAHQLLGSEAPVRRALDVGCGTGMSSVALLALAREVVGVDAAIEMIRHGRRTKGLRYVVSAAESLPFRGHPFEIVSACGAIDWIDRERFLPRVAELLVSGGWLVSLDFGHAGRSTAIPGLEEWHRDTFRRRYPPPPTADPILTGDEAAQHGFEAPVRAELLMTWKCSATRYAEFLLTESNVIAAVEYAHAGVDEIRAWLREELASLFGDEARAVIFDGYVQALRRL